MMTEGVITLPPAPLCWASLAPQIPLMTLHEGRLETDKFRMQSEDPLAIILSDCARASLASASAIRVGVDALAASRIL